MGIFSTLFGSVISKIYAAVIVALLIAAGLFYWQWTSYEAKYDTDHAALTTTKTQLKEVQETLHKLQESQKISDDTRKAISDDKTTIDKKVDVIHTQEKTQVNAIVDKYKVLPQTDENEKKEATEISSVRVDSMWKTYCASGAADAPCSAASAASGGQ